MKTLSFYAVLLFSIFSFNISSAQLVKKETIKVWGNCSMCKSKIEKTAKLAGATTASRNENSKELKVSYAVNKTSRTKIQETIAKAGYDTQDFTANNNAYEKLHACCQYERKDTAGMKSDKKCCSMASGKRDGKAMVCKDMICCKGKSCCDRSTGITIDKKCCNMASDKGDGKATSCKEMACCKEKTCCNKMDNED